MMILSCYTRLHLASSSNFRDQNQKKFLRQFRNPQPPRQIKKMAKRKVKMAKLKREVNFRANTMILLIHCSITIILGSGLSTVLLYNFMCFDYKLLL